MQKVPPQLIIILTAALLFMHSLGKAPLFDWDEINFAESAREMIETGNYMQVQVNYEPFWEKPPFYFWMTAASMKVFGVNEFAARFPNAVCGIVTLLVIFSIGRRLHDRRFAAWWTLIHAGSFLPNLYFQSGIIDPWFNFFIFLGIYFLSGFLSSPDTGKIPLPNLLLSALFTGMGACQVLSYLGGGRVGGHDALVRTGDPAARMVVRE
jgi:4-amino-4-deoxy-L-arabinose transferase-like glycosyltransferase